MEFITYREGEGDRDQLTHINLDYVREMPKEKYWETYGLCLVGHPEGHTAMMT